MCSDKTCVLSSSTPAIIEAINSRTPGKLHLSSSYIVVISSFSPPWFFFFRQVSINSKCIFMFTVFIYWHDNFPPDREILSQAAKFALCREVSNFNGIPLNCYTRVFASPLRVPANYVIKLPKCFNLRHNRIQFLEPKHTLIWC